MREIYLAGGCFWGVQAYYDKKEGILETIVGYANGNVDCPTYEQVCTKTTGHAETLHIKFDEKVLLLEEILNYFWRIIDPTVLNRQGPDIGSQYRTGVYYTDETMLDTIISSRDNEQKNYNTPIVTEIEKLVIFFPAEEYHQKYLEKNPNGYCHIDLSL